MQLSRQVHNQVHLVLEREIKYLLPYKNYLNSRYAVLGGGGELEVVLHYVEDRDKMEGDDKLPKQAKLINKMLSLRYLVEVTLH